MLECWGWREGDISCGSLRVSGADVCEELRGRMIAVCCLYEVRLRGWGARMLGMEGRRYKVWWSRKGDGVGSVGVIVKKDLCRKMVEIRRASNGSLAGFCRGCAEVSL